MPFISLVKGDYILYKITDKYKVLAEFVQYWESTDIDKLYNSPDCNFCQVSVNGMLITICTDRITNKLQPYEVLKWQITH